MRFRNPGLPLVSLLCFFLSPLLTSCGMVNPPQDHYPVEFTAAPDPHGDNKFPNWPVQPKVLEKELILLVETGQEIPEKAKTTEHGVSGPKKIKLYFPDQHLEVTFKWKASPKDGLDNYNNSIAREIATYQLQKLFLDPEDYVVPTSLAFCIDQARHHKSLSPETPQVNGSQCIFGNASVWLQDVEIVDELYQESRFLNEPNYAYFLSNFNILTYLAAHRDARAANILIAKDDKRRQVFMVDNTTTYGTTPYNPYVFNWNIIRVPALRKASIDRLRKVKREDLDGLGVVAQLDRDNDRIFKNVPPGNNLNAEKPVRIRKGMVQFGLTKEQIDGVWDRLQKLIEEVDSGKIPVF